MGDHHNNDHTNPVPFEVSHIPDDPLIPAVNRPKESRFSYCVSRILLLIILWFLILSLIIFIAWLIMNPQDPAFRLNSLSVCNITVSDSKFTANYHIEFTVVNKNKKVSLLIDQINVKVLFGKAVISEKVLEQIFHFEKMSQGTLQAELGRDSVHSVKGRVFKDLSDAWSTKIVSDSFNVQTWVRTGFESSVWPTKLRFLRVSCMNLSVEFLSTKGTGKLMSGGKDCLVHSA